jgi:type II secretory pathway component HofQ
VRLAALAVIAALALPTAAAEKTVTLDVKDAELRPLLKDMQRQCGIKNLVIDPDVQGSGATFLFHEVPCTQAFDVVFKTFSLAAVQYENSVVHVSRRK